MRGLLLVLFISIVSFAEVVSPLAAKGFYPTQSLGITNDGSVDIAVGDIDKDGDIDVVVANDGQKNRLYLNRGDGTFIQTDINSDANKTRGLKLVDMDSDGDLDIVTAEGAETGTISSKLYFNDGHGIFSTKVGFEERNAPDYAKSIATGDFNGDGKLDVVIAYYEENRVCLQGNTASDWSCSNLSNDAYHTTDVAVGDIDEDGYIDIVVSNANNYSCVYFNDGTASFSRSTFGRSNELSYSVAIGDVDRDNHLDIILGNYLDTSRIYHYKGNSTLISSSDIGTQTTYKSYGISVGDIDRDGDLDIFLANNEQINLLYLNSGTGNFSDSDMYALDDLSRSYKIVMADVDANNNNDLLCANGTSFNTLILSKNRYAFLPSVISLLLSETVAVTAPLAPNSLSVVPLNQSSDALEVRWSDRSNNETSFIIYRSTSSDANIKVQVGTVGANTTSFSDTNLDSCRRYYYWVEAKNSEYQALSSSASAVTSPASPTGLIASQGTVLNAIYLNWNAQSCADSYKVYQAHTDGIWEYKGLVPNNLVDMAPAQPGLGLIYKISSVKNGFEGTFSSEAIGWAGSSTPKNLVANRGEYTDRVNLAWSAVQVCPNSQGVQARYINLYDIYYSTTQNGTYQYLGSYAEDGNFNNFMSVPTATNPIVVNVADKIAANQHYFFKIRAIYQDDLDCNGIADTTTVYGSDFSNIAEGWMVSAPANTYTYLPAPAWVNATDGEFCHITITWASIPGANSYRIFRASSPYGPWTSRGVGGTSTQDNVTADLSTIVWTGYWYKVVGIDANGKYGYANDPEGGYAGRVVGTNCY